MPRGAGARGAAQAGPLLVLLVVACLAAAAPLAAAHGDFAAEFAAAQQWASGQGQGQPQQQQDHQQQQQEQQQHTPACGHALASAEHRRWSDGHRRARAAEAARSPAAAARHAPPRQLAETAPAGAPRPLRVWVEYQATETLEPELNQKLRDTVNVALGVLQKYFRARRAPAGPLLAPALCVVYDTAGYCNQYQPDLLNPGANKKLQLCGLAKVNGSHIAPYRQCSLGGGSCSDYQGGTGEHTDYYLYITAQQDNHCASGAVAWALPCLYDTSTNRPLLGSANVCPANLAAADSEAAVSVLVHELLHGLGFTDDSFDRFVDSTGAPIPKDQVVKEITDAYGRPTTLVISPTVAAETRAQFGCDSVPGAALENEGGQGSANAHWEYRWFQGELMVATNLFAVYGKPATMSRITLAFMQDTGWYDIDWDAAGFLDWGYKAGCDFVLATCDAFMAANPSQRFYCGKEDFSVTTNSVCTFDGMARAKCEEAQFADGCVMKMALYAAPNCLTPQYATAAGDKFGWAAGLDSRCYPVTWLFNNGAYQFPDSTFKDGWKDAVCFQSTCNQQGVLQVKLFDRTLDCPTNATLDLPKLMPDRYRAGSIGPCPDNAAACQTLACGPACAVGGVCRGGKCYCNLEFTGPGCEQRLTPSGAYTRYDPTPGGANATDGQSASGYLMLSAELSNSQEELLSALDRYKVAAAQLAGVAVARVAVLSFTTNRPAASIVGGGGGGGGGVGGGVVVGGGGGGGGAGAGGLEGGEKKDTRSRRRQLLALLLGGGEGGEGQQRLVSLEGFGGGGSSSGGGGGGDAGSAALALQPALAGAGGGPATDAVAAALAGVLAARGGGGAPGGGVFGDGGANAGAALGAVTLNGRALPLPVPLPLTATAVRVDGAPDGPPPPAASRRRRRLAQAGGGGGGERLQVFSRIATLSPADGDAIGARITNDTRQSAFAAALEKAGLRLVPGSILVQTPSDVGGSVFGIRDPNTIRMIIIIVAAAAALTVLTAVCCCAWRVITRFRELALKRRPPPGGWVQRGVGGAAGPAPVPPPALPALAAAASAPLAVNGAGPGGRAGSAYYEFGNPLVMARSVPHPGSAAGAAAPPPGYPPQRAPPRPAGRGGSPRRAKSRSPRRGGGGPGPGATPLSPHSTWAVRGEDGLFYVQGSAFATREEAEQFAVDLAVARSLQETRGGGGGGGGGALGHAGRSAAF
ncbi:leishmanolysin-like peptidase [Raphidocelis subcapitata]|uniref:Leishmanolysin-like peptidase n=1 Tax=Raphidocelis subcapitata TaxID=307507 RepID=A0A2V0NY11_9CHLO|nr:leishmanolysin-like peptidase [Raphidocelis subcapitata]|eukprot:GBF91572.1 leishmanolysin-like peptidase [Raphidocelis subcapitata]